MVFYHMLTYNMCMTLRKIRGFLIPFVTFCAIIGASATLIAYGRGYRPDFRKNTLKPTGIISATSDPISAQVYINGVLRTATNNSINTDPNWYTVRITKEGYIPWEKQVRVQGEIVARADAFLFPTNPSLSSLTSLGVIKPTLSQDGTRIAYIVKKKKKTDAVAVRNAGIWVYELADRPLSVNRDPKHIASWENFTDPEKVSFLWSPDATQLLVADELSVRLYQASRMDDFKIVTASYKSILQEWREDSDAKDKQRLSAFKQPVIDMATTSARIIAFSPDETKLLYEATASATLPQVIIPPLIGTNATKEERTIQPGKLYVYDSREDKNFFVLDKKEIPVTKPQTLYKTTSPIGNWKLEIGNSSPPVGGLVWFPTNRHLLLMLQGKIDVMEYDRTNWTTVYSGPFTDGFMAPWPNGSRIIILTNLNPGASTLPNLYTINLR